MTWYEDASTMGWAHFRSLVRGYVVHLLPISSKGCATGDCMQKLCPECDDRTSGRIIFSL